MNEEANHDEEEKRTEEEEIEIPDEIVNGRGLDKEEMKEAVEDVNDVWLEIREKLKNLDENERVTLLQLKEIAMETLMPEMSKKKIWTIVFLIKHCNDTFKTWQEMAKQKKKTSETNTTGNTIGKRSTEGTKAAQSSNTLGKGNNEEEGRQYRQIYH